MAKSKKDSAPVRQAHAAGVASASSLSGDKSVAERIEAAMHQAIQECLDQGITDPDAQRERMLAAREAVLGE